MNKFKGFIGAVLLICLSQLVFAIKKDYIKITPNPDKERIDVTINGELFTSLMYADSLKKPALYPIYTSEQNMITRGWPIMPKHMDRTDYIHQVGLWFSFGDVNGADYWTNFKGEDTTKKAYGTIKFQKVISISSGSGKATLTVSFRWFNPGSKAVLDETSVFTFRVDGTNRIIDRAVTLKALTNVDFKDNKNGMFGIRLATELGQPVTSLESAILSDKAITSPSDSLPLTGRYTSSDGIKGEAVFGKRAKWMQLTGRVNQEQVTVVMMDHPQNINYPGFWLARSYGLMAVNNFGSEIFTNGAEKLNFSLAKGKQASFKYRFVQGGRHIDDDTLNKLYSDFAGESL